MGGPHVAHFSSDDGKFELAMRKVESKHGKGWLNDVFDKRTVKLKNKHTSLKRRQISKTIRSGRSRVTLPMFNGRKILKGGIYIF